MNCTANMMTMRPHMIQDMRTPDCTKNDKRCTQAIIAEKLFFFKYEMNIAAVEVRIA